MPDAGTKRGPASHELVGVGVCDRDLRIVVVNNAWAAMDNLAPEDHKGKTVPEVLDVVACPMEEAMRHVLITGEPIFGLEVIAKVPARRDVGRWIVNLIPFKMGQGIRLMWAMSLSKRLRERVSSSSWSLGAIRRITAQFRSHAAILGKMLWNN